MAHALALEYLSATLAAPALPSATAARLLDPPGGLLMARARDRVQSAFTLHAHGLGARIISGVGFKLFGVFARTVLTLGSTAVLARLLLPADYGYLVMATIVTELAALFSSAGITDTLVQRKRVSRVEFDTAFWTLLLIGIALAGAVGLVSLGAGAIFGDPKVAPIVLALGLLFPVSSLVGVPNVVMSRLMDFKGEFYITTASLLIRSVAAIVAAKAGLGVWSLVVGAYTGSLVTLLLTFARYPFLPRLRFSTHYVRKSWRVSSLYLGGGLVYYVNMNADLLLVSRYWGAAPLGLYQNARALADELRARLAAPLAQTLFPAFSSVQTDTARMASLFIRGSQVLASVIMLLGSVLSATAQEVVELLFGQRWLPMVPLVAMFSLSAAVRGATALASPLLNAANRPGFVLKHHLTGTLLMIAAVVAVLPMGIEYVAAAVALTSLYSLVPYYFAVRTIGFTLRSVAQVMAGPMIAALSCVAAVSGMRHLCEPADFDVHQRLALFAAVGAGSYLAVLTLVAREHVREIISLTRQVLRRRRNG